MFELERRLGLMTRDQARGRLRDAVRYGRILKPDHCTRCSNKTERRLLHGHHVNGYDKPLDVEWICVSCHNIVDRAALVENGHRMKANLIPNAAMVYGRRKGR